MQTSLMGIAKKAKSEPKHQFRNLFGILNEANLKWSMQFLKKRAAPGVDNVDYGEYEKNLVGNVRNLVGRVKRGSYRAKLVRRKYIPKGNGKKRPLGIPTVEDKLLQMAVKQILQAIYEQDFLSCSYGYRPEKGSLDAVGALTRGLWFGKYGYVVEADIKSFYDNIDHELLIRMLEKRIDDRPFIRLIKKWLRAGILEEDGRVIHPETGTPQGGVVSSILANIYLHHALDVWFRKTKKRQYRGETRLIRYADDFVVAFQYKEEAQEFHKELEERLKEFGLEVAEEKTRVLRFSKDDKQGSSTFDFLGFEFRWITNKEGKDVITRRTSRKKFRAAVARFKDWIKRSRSFRLGLLMKTLKAKYRGHGNYYGVIGNSESLNDYYRQTQKLLFKWLNRRSQRLGYDWNGFNQMLKSFGIEGPRIVEKRNV